MLKLIAVESQGGTKLLLRFSDSASGVYDFAPIIEADTEMTAPLRDPAFFARHFIEAGALAWPNGFDLSAGSLYRHIKADGKLHHAAEAA
ncbi:DUF2442 domain-containing protein [Metallibacterium sp.]|uniref:DUF2442 domain-containing protein n=1 Tax=Metallibacterium sp. TaxID=2940281 RepID=UPI00263556E5|nr:DUF2442 domain-containing protein [Metallibacterium sp.]